MSEEHVLEYVDDIESAGRKFAEKLNDINDRLTEPGNPFECLIAYHAIVKEVISLSSDIDMAISNLKTKIQGTDNE